MTCANCILIKFYASVYDYWYSENVNTVSVIVAGVADVSGDGMSAH